MPRPSRPDAHETLQDHRFLLFEMLGRGGMGTVFRAFDRVERRNVALKVLDEEACPGPAHPLGVEFEAWSRMRHPNVVRVLELGRARHGPLPPGTPYLVLEYFPGRPAHRVLRPGRVSRGALAAFARHALLGLAHVHRAGLVHRDLKPGNVLVADRSPLRVKLTDFGLAERSGVRRAPGRISGSLPYIAPEAMLGGPLDARADLYALGVLLFFLATGRPASDTIDPGAIVRWHLAGARTDPRTLRPSIGGKLGGLIASLTARRREDRPRSAEQALERMGERAPAAPSTAASCPDDRLGALRLAFDAARLGGSRVLALPRQAGPAAALLAELRVLAGLHGVAFHPIARVPGAARSDLDRVVLHLLLARADRTVELSRRHRLLDGLPLGLLGRVPVWDRERAERGPAFDDPGTLRAVAAGVAAFVFESARRRTLVLYVEPRARIDPLLREVAHELRRLAAADPGPDPQRGGLLLVV